MSTKSPSADIRCKVTPLFDEEVITLHTLSLTHTHLHILICGDFSLPFSVASQWLRINYRRLHTHTHFVNEHISKTTHSCWLHTNAHTNEEQKPPHQTKFITQIAEIILRNDEKIRRQWWTVHKGGTNENAIYERDSECWSQFIISFFRLKRRPYWLVSHKDLIIYRCVGKCSNHVEFNENENIDDSAEKKNGHWRRTRVKWRSDSVGEEKRD